MVGYPRAVGPLEPTKWPAEAKAPCGWAGRLRTQWSTVILEIERARIDMAKSKSSTAAVTPKEDNAVVKYFKETRAELRKVVWPTREETKNLTLIIVSVTVAMAMFLGLLDYIFQIVAAGVISGNYIWIGVAVILFIAGAAAFYFNIRQE